MPSAPIFFSKLKSSLSILQCLLSEAGQSILIITHITKALGWVLLSRHARRGMGHYRFGSTVLASRPSLPPALEAGEGVGTQISATTVAPGPAQDSSVMDRKIQWRVIIDPEFGLALLALSHLPLFLFLF